MRQKRRSKPETAEPTVRDIRRTTRRQYSAEKKIRIVLDVLFCGLSDLAMRPGNVRLALPCSTGERK